MSNDTDLPERLRDIDFEALVAQSAPPDPALLERVRELIQDVGPVDLSAPLEGDD